MSNNMREALLLCIATLERTNHCTDGDRLKAASAARAALAAPAPVAQPVGVMSRATVALGSGAGYKEIRLQFDDLEDAEQVRLWAVSCGSQMALASIPAKQGDPLPGMSDINRAIAYSAASKLRGLGFKWDGREWAAPAPVALTPAQQRADELVVALRGVMNLHTHNIHTASAWDELLKRARAVLAAIEATGQEGGEA